MANIKERAESAAESIIAHIAYLQREEAFIAGVYKEYEGLKSLDDKLAAAGVLDLVRSIAAENK